MARLDLAFVNRLSLVDEPEVGDARFLVTKRHEPDTDETATEHIEKKSVAGVSFTCKRNGKLDESEIDKEETDLGSHYLYGSGDDKSDYSYPVVGADNCLYRGNVDSAWSLGCRGQCSDADAHDEKLKTLGKEFDDNPIPDEAYQKRASSDEQHRADPAESGTGRDADNTIHMDEDELEDRLETQHEQTVEAATEAAYEAVEKALSDDDTESEDEDLEGDDVENDVVKRLIGELEAQGVIETDDDPESDIEKRIETLEKSLQNGGRRGVATQASGDGENGFTDRFVAEAGGED